MSIQVPRCRICHRRLKSSAAITKGAGKHCLRKERGTACKAPKQRIGAAQVNTDPDQLEFAFAARALPTEPRRSTGGAHD